MQVFAKAPLRAKLQDVAPMTKSPLHMFYLSQGKGDETGF